MQKRVYHVNTVLAMKMVGPVMVSWIIVHSRKDQWVVLDIQGSEETLVIKEMLDLKVNLVKMENQVLKDPRVKLDHLEIKDLLEMMYLYIVIDQDHKDRKEKWE